jgi:DNA-binding transcriptional ArsR family regulator
MSPETMQALLEFFKALGNESRLKLLGILAQRECSVEELAALLQLKEPTVSHHLTKLKLLNLVTLKPEGNTHLYSLNTEQLQALQKAILTPEQLQTLAHDVQPEAWEAKVLKTFMQGEQILEIPASRKKRLVLLQWLVRQFEPERDYPEQELNALIKRHHPDTATLRREMIGYRLMTRDQGIYQRTPESEWQDENLPAT